jgi:hypothetical protein
MLHALNTINSRGLTALRLQTASFHPIQGDPVLPSPGLPLNVRTEFHQSCHLDVSHRPCFSYVLNQPARGARWIQPL